MANNKQRYINTKFWNDGYISELDPIEKLMFIYFLTNEHTNISGIYELPIKIIGIETGIDSSMIKKVLPRLEDKIRYVDGYIIIKNFVKHQETGSHLVEKGIINCLKDLDQELLKNVIYKGFYELPKVYLDTLTIEYIKGSNYSNSNLDSNSNSIPPEKSDGEVVSEVINLFKEINPSYKKLFGSPPQRKAVTRLLETHGQEQLVKVIQVLQKTNKMTYMPTITTPVQLEDKWASLESNLIKKKVASEEKKNYVL